MPADIDQGAGRAYEELLDRVLEDRLIAHDEALALCELAGSWGSITSTSVLDGRGGNGLSALTPPRAQ